MATEQPHDVIQKTIQLDAETKRIYGPKWNEPNPAYEFSNGRKFTLRTEDAAIYITSPDFG